jgi:hypothetical protein
VPLHLLLGAAQLVPTPEVAPAPLLDLDHTHASWTTPRTVSSVGMQCKTHLCSLLIKSSSGLFIWLTVINNIIKRGYYSSVDSSSKDKIWQQSIARMHICTGTAGNPYIPLYQCSIDGRRHIDSIN